MSSPSTMSFTPRHRVTRQAPSHYDRSSSSQIASSSKSSFSKFPEFTQLMDMDMDVDTDDMDALTERETASERSAATATKTPQAPLTPAATLRALLAKLPSTSTTPTQPPSRYPSERESEYDISAATRGAPSVQESVRSIFSKAMGDSDETPTRPPPRHDSFDERENEATPMPGRGIHRSFKSNDSGDFNHHPARTVSKFMGSSQPITQEFMREQFNEDEMSDTEFLHSPSASHDNNNKSTMSLDDLGASQAPIATSTPQHSLSLSVGSHFQSNLLDHNTEMRNELDYSDFQDDMFSDVEVPEEKSQSRFATDISNVSHNRSPRQLSRENSKSEKRSPFSSPSVPKGTNTSTSHLNYDFSVASGKSASPSTTRHTPSPRPERSNVREQTREYSHASYDSRGHYDMDITDAEPEQSTSTPANDVSEKSANRSSSIAWESAQRSTRTPSPPPAVSPEERSTASSRWPSFSATPHALRPAAELARTPSPLPTQGNDERSTSSGRRSNLSSTPRVSRSMVDNSRRDSPSTSTHQERQHNESNAWTASMSIDTWQQSPYRASSPQFPQQILKEEEDHRYSVEDEVEEESAVVETPMRTPRSLSGRREPEISSPSPSKVPALPSPESSPQSESKVPWAYSRNRHPMTPGFATPRPPGGWLNTPKQPRYAGSEVGNEDSSVAPQAEPTLTKTPRPPGGWATPMPRPVPNSANNESRVDDSNAATPRDAGLLTPIPSLSKLSALNFKTPAPPGGWAQTPAAKKSILKVRFDANSSHNPLGEGPSRQPLQPEEDVSNIHSSPSRPKKAPKIRVLDAFGREADDETKTEEAEVNLSKIRVVDEMGQEVKSEPSITEETPASRVTSLTQLRQGLNQLMEEIDDFDDDSDDSADHSRVQNLVQTSATARQNAAQIQSNLKSGIKSKIFWSHHKSAWWYWPVVGITQIILIVLMFFFCLRLTRTMFLENYWEPFNPEVHLNGFDKQNFLQVNRTVWFSLRTFEWLDWSNYLLKPKQYLLHLWDVSGTQQPDKLWPLT